MSTGDQARTVKGEYLEIGYPDWKMIRVYQDGPVILRAAADHELLCWGREEPQFLERPRVNPVALVELTYSFVKLCSDLLRFYEVEVSSSLTKSAR